MPGDRRASLCASPDWYPVSARYVVRPKADQDLDDQAYYLATQANPEVGHKFLLAPHETFSLLATQPEMGWNWLVTLRSASEKQNHRLL